MGKLRLGEMTELASRVKKQECYSELLNKRMLDNDALIEDNTMRIDEHGTRLDGHDNHLAEHDRHLEAIDNELYYDEGSERKSRLSRLEDTKVVKGNQEITEIRPIFGPE